MIVRLLHRHRDLDPQHPLPWGAETLTQDLALKVLFDAMAQSDPFIFEVAKKVTLSGSENDLDTIRYRQDILRDCLNHPGIVRELYAIAAEAMEKEKKHYLGILARHPDWILRDSIEVTATYLDSIKKLRRIADAQASSFASEGWTALFTTLQRELSDAYFLRAEFHLEQLRFRNGALLGAGLGEGNKGRRYSLLCPQQDPKQSWLTKLFGRRPPAPDFSLDPRDESGIRALTELQNRGIASVANAVARSAEHVRGFFSRLRTELAFYAGCLNLHEQLAQKGESVCFPEPATAEERPLSFRGLYDAGLALRLNQRVVGNDANADQQDLLIVTGANQGGKSTFLRSVGVAQIMMQCGMFVAADSFRSGIHDGLFTHYKREEDPDMKSGKLDEELSRMSDIISHITPHPMLLFNESFAATNEREGSEIARQILSALLDKRAKVVCVTHLYELAHGFYLRNGGNILFLRAQRQADGARTFQLAEGEPLPTSFGEDVYNSIFNVGAGHGATDDPKEGP